MTTQATLYERLGGAGAIANVVDDFIDRNLRNPETMSNQSVSDGYAKITAPGIKYLVTEMVCDVTGGPQTYTGKTMADSHSHLDIGEKDWDLFIDDLKESLALFGVPKTEQDELLTILATTKGDIVT
jgi:hemoglobin